MHLKIKIIALSFHFTATLQIIASQSQR